MGEELLALCTIVAEAVCGHISQSRAHEGAHRVADRAEEAPPRRPQHGWCPAPRDMPRGSICQPNLICILHSISSAAGSWPRRLRGSPWRLRGQHRKPLCVRWPCQELAARASSCGLKYVSSQTPGAWIHPISPQTPYRDAPVIASFSTIPCWHWTFQSLKIVCSRTFCSTMYMGCLHVINGGIHYPPHYLLGSDWEWTLEPLHYPRG